MSIYFGDDGAVKKGYLNHYNQAVWFGYFDDNGTMKKFYDVTEAIEKIVIYPQYLFLDKTTPNMTNATEAKISDLSGYGSVTIGSNYIQTVSNRNSSSIWVMVSGEIKFKSYASNYGYYPVDELFSIYRKFDASIIKYVFSATGYVFFRSNTSTASIGYALNTLFDGDIANCSASTSSTVTKTFNESKSITEGYAFGYIGAGRQSGSQNITSKITFNSFSINGVSIPVVVENRLS